MSTSLEMKQIKKACCVCIASLLVISGCDVDKTIKPPEKINGYIYKPSTNALTIHGIEFKNTYQVSSDKTNKFYIFSTVENKKQPNLKLFDISANKIKDVSHSQFIEFDPVVNTHGDFAFAQHTDSVGISKVYLNNKEINLPIGLYKSLAINDQFLAFSGIIGNAEKSTLYILDLATYKLRTISLQQVVSSLFFISNELLVVDGIDITSDENSTFEVYISDLTITQYTHPKHENCYPKNYQWHNEPEFSCFDKIKEHKPHLIYLAMRNILTNDPTLALACSDNSLGRISWFVSYRLLALIEIMNDKALLSLVTDRYKYPVKEIFNNAVNCLLDTNQLGWPTKKYSLDKQTYLSLLVDDASILFPLLKAARLNLLSTTQKIAVVSLVQDYYEFQEKNFDDTEKLYRFKYGIKFWADGVVLPWNMDNMFGLVLIEAYKLTGDEKYKRRVLELANSFRDEWVFNPDGSVKWHYWPMSFYSGWDESDKVSVNTPAKHESNDSLFEDISHSGVNVLFITRFMDAFGQNIFTNSDLMALRLTLENIKTIQGKFSHFLSGDIRYQVPSLRFIPNFGWADFFVNSGYIPLYPSYFPLFEDASAYDYLRMYR